MNNASIKANLIFDFFFIGKQVLSNEYYRSVDIFKGLFQLYKWILKFDFIRMQNDIKIYSIFCMDRTIGHKFNPMIPRPQSLSPIVPQSYSPSSIIQITGCLTGRFLITSEWVG